MAAILGRVACVRDACEMRARCVRARCVRDIGPREMRAGRDEYGIDSDGPMGGAMLQINVRFSRSECVRVWHFVCTNRDWSQRFMYRPSVGTDLSRIKQYLLSTDLSTCSVDSTDPEPQTSV